ncbi:MAG: NADH:ubiquinone oxidoreductase subunit N, partial [Burkholderiales bacterium]
LIGMPPLGGFMAKFYLFAASVRSGHVALTVIAVLNSALGAYYYLRLVKLMYFDAPADTAPIAPRLDVRVVLSLNGLVMLVFGIFPERLMWLCRYSIQVSL